jgi:hypothetical protein
LKYWARYGDDWGVRTSAVEVLSRFYSSDPDIFPILIHLVQEDADWGVRYNSIEAIVKHYYNAPKIFELLCDLIQKDPFVRTHSEQNNPRQPALQALLAQYPTHTKTHELLRERALNDSDEQLREWAQVQLEKLKKEGR